MQYSQETFTTITVALHEHIRTMLCKHDESTSTFFLEEANRANNAYRELMGEDDPLWKRYLAVRGVIIQ